MELILQGIKEAFYLIFSLDSEVLQILFLSLEVSGIALIIALFVGVPIGVFLALSSFPGKKIFLSIINALMGIPPVLVGLIIMLFLWPVGPLGFLNWLYTPFSMIIAQILLALPIVTALSTSAIQTLNPNLILQAISLGANKIQLAWILIKEARMTLLASLMAAFGAIFSEVGAVLMVGGNIKGETRVLTTAILMESRKGNFKISLALGIILLAVIFLINLGITLIQQKDK
ncbi:MAG: ABC transporter permease [Armatimonadetes bacterium]|nr:ABC transporter permease [Armatimonadota bacterium]